MRQSVAGRKNLLCGPHFGQPWFRLLRPEQKRLFLGSSMLSEAVVAIARYTLDKPVRKKFKRRKTIVPGARFQMQADLVDFSLLKSYNDNYKYILVVVDVFSKKAVVIRVCRMRGCSVPRFS